MASIIAKLTGSGQTKSEGTPPKPRRSKNPLMPAHPVPVRTEYISNDVEIPDKFLKVPAPDRWEPVSIQKIDFTAGGLPEYEGASAWILENVLTRSECDKLLELVEASTEAGENGDKWKPAMVNLGPGYEIMATDYRNSDRIIWDQADVMSRIMDRCFEAEGLKKQLSAVVGDESCLGPRAAKTNEGWIFTKPNERMRFLRYKDGHFFSRHCDGSYEHVKVGEIYERSLFTLHLYLSSSEDLKGGATAFYANRHQDRKMEVAPKVGRVLIFQHRSLLHSGEPVTGSGTKYTMRTDLMYKQDYK